MSFIHRLLRAKAERSGISTVGKWYCRGLAEFPGDPRAWISSASDVRRIAEERKFNVSGVVNYNAREVAPASDIDVAPDLIYNEVSDILAAEPYRSRDEVYEQVLNERREFPEVAQNGQSLAERLHEEFAKALITYDQIEESCKE